MKQNLSLCLLSLVGIISYNIFLIQRDAKMFEAYDRVCETQPYNPKCIYSK